MTAALRKTLEVEIDDPPVLLAGDLASGTDRHSIGRRSDDVWDLSKAVPRQNARRCHVTAYFEAINDAGIREQVRDHVWCRLNFDVPGGRRRLHPASLRQEFNRSRRFFEFVGTKFGIFDSRLLTQVHLDAWLRYLLEERKLRPVIAAQELAVPLDLYSYRSRLKGGGINFVPWDGFEVRDLVGELKTSSENNTPCIPEEIINPLVYWSLQYIRYFSKDILAARRATDDLVARRDALIQMDQGLDLQALRDRHFSRVRQYMANRMEQSRGVPVWVNGERAQTQSGQSPSLEGISVNYSLLHLHAGIDVRRQPKLHLGLRGGISALLREAFERYGVEPGGLDALISNRPGRDVPWRSRFDAMSLAKEERMLQAACYVVCAYLTGMRDSEVQAMCPGCLKVERNEAGEIERFKVESQAFKGEGTRLGVTEKWVTVKEVAEAIEVLEVLSAHAAKVRGSATLWPVLRIRPNGEMPVHGKANVSAEIVRQLNEFRDHLNELFSDGDALAVPTRDDGTPWRITTRQFRRTIARHIACRPFGTVAGMIQYKHVQIATFEGYAGTPQSGFPSDVESERRAGQIEDMLTYFDQRAAGATHAGPAGAGLNAYLDSVADQLAPLPGMIADRSRLTAMLKSESRTLFAGRLNDCFFDPMKALCLQKGMSSSSSLPIVSMCEPTLCPNSTMSSRHRPAWTFSLESVKGLLREKRLSQVQRTALEQEKNRLKSIIAQIPC